MAEKKDWKWRLVHPFEAFKPQGTFEVLFFVNGERHQVIYYSADLKETLADIKRQFPNAKNLQYRLYTWMGPVSRPLVWRKA